MPEGHPFDRLRAGSQTPGKGAPTLCTAPLFSSLLVAGSPATAAAAEQLHES